MGTETTCDVVRAIALMCISACAELRAALAAPPAPPRLNPWRKRLRPTWCCDYDTGISTANPAGNNGGLFAGSVSLLRRCCLSSRAVHVQLWRCKSCLTGQLVVVKGVSKPSVSEEKAKKARLHILETRFVNAKLKYFDF